MKNTIRTAVILVCLIFGSTLASAQSANEIYQVSTINALLQGVYDGEITFKELKQHGDFGIGTFNALDGEMIGLGGQFYQVKSSGQVLPVNNSIKTPFAAVLYFKPQRVAELGAVQDYDQLQESLNSIINDQNYFYAIRIDGLFTYVKTRSVPAQSKPYRPLTEVTKTQAVFEFENVRGTVIGFWCPKYVNGVNVPGYHLHFISDDRKQGGHLLAISLLSGKVQIARITNFRMVLPGAEDFRNAALGKDYSKDLQTAEQ